MYYWSGTNSCPTTYSLSVIIILNVGWLMWRLSLANTNSIPAFSTLWAKFFTRPFLVQSEGSGVQTTLGNRVEPRWYDELGNQCITNPYWVRSLLHHKKDWWCQAVSLPLYLLPHKGRMKYTLRMNWLMQYVHLLFHIPSTAYDVELLDDKVPCVGRCLLWFGTHCKCVFRASFSGHS